MSVFEVPLSSVDPNYTIEATFDGVTFSMAIRWNARSSEWFFDLSDLDGNSIIGGRKLVPGAPLLRHAADFDVRPAGELLMIGTPTRDNLGSEAATLVYADEEELAAS